MTTTGGTGFRYTPIPVAWNSRDAILYALSIGVKGEDLQFLFATNGQSLINPAAKGESQDLIPFSKKEKSGIAEPITGAPHLDIKKMVDGGRAIEFLKRIPVSSQGHKFELQSQVVGVFDKGKVGTVVSSSTDFIDTTTGGVFARITANHVYIGQGDWGGPRGPATMSYPAPQRKADAVYDIPTSKETAALYRLNGDTNPLHLLPENGIKMGFDGPILHGLYFWNAAAYAVLKQWGDSDGANMKKFEARFSAPVAPGRTVRVSSWATDNFDNDGFQEIRFVAEIIGGKMCLSNGRAFVKAARSKL